VKGPWFVEKERMRLVSWVFDGERMKGRHTWNPAEMRVTSLFSHSDDAQTSHKRQE
jgi:hypothetical protein